MGLAELTVYLPFGRSVVAESFHGAAGEVRRRRHSWRKEAAPRRVHCRHGIEVEATAVQSLLGREHRAKLAVGSLALEYHFRTGRTDLALVVTAMIVEDGFE